MTDAVAKLRAEMSANNIDAVILTDGANRRYFSGFTGTAGTVFITADDCIFMTDSRYILQSRQQCIDFEIKELYGKNMIDYVSDYCIRNSVKNIWIDENSLTYARYKGFFYALGVAVNFIDGANCFSKIRAIKNADEIEIMKSAAKIAGDAFMRTVSMLEPGMSELYVAGMFEKYVLDAGAKTAFIIVASGENAALPHHEANERKIAYGDIVTVDFGVNYKGYNSDCTRTFAIGKVPKELENIYNIVDRAQRTAAMQVAPGKVCSELDKIARDIITAEGYGNNFGHSLGHGLGLDVHEMPSLSKFSKTVLQPGMFVTVEPGIYVENLGGVRIEDTLLVTENGSVNITDDVPKSLFIREF